MTINQLIEMLKEHDGETEIVNWKWNTASSTSNDFDFSHVKIGNDGIARLIACETPIR